MSGNNRARRRSDAKRIKSRMRRMVRAIYRYTDITPLTVGKMASTHGKPCSCSLGCGNRRAYSGPSIGERRAFLREYDE